MESQFHGEGRKGRSFSRKKISYRFSLHVRFKVRPLGLNNIFLEIQIHYSFLPILFDHFSFIHKIQAYTEHLL